MRRMFASDQGQRINGQHHCQYCLFHNVCFSAPGGRSFPYFPLLPVREILSPPREPTRWVIFPRSSLRPRACSRVESFGLFCVFKRLLRGSHCL